MFASFKGYASPLRHGATIGSCRSGGHELWWTVEAASEVEALALLPLTSPSAPRQPRSARSGSHDDPRPSQQRPKELSMASIAIPAVETRDW